MLLPLLQNNLLSDGPVFIGPSIASFSLQIDVAMSPRDFSTRFAGTSLTFAIVGTLPDGLSLSSAGVLSGTPTTLGTATALKIRATDGAAATEDSNEFNITITVAGFGDIGGENVGGDDLGTDDLGGDVLNTPGWWVN